tara:strand:+ start:151 stop:474 length:324 start_codon:yes stop_codon:yes gene_type:complete
MFKSLVQYVSASETESEPMETLQNQLEHTIENKNKQIQTQMKSVQKTKIKHSMEKKKDSPKTSIKDIEIDYQIPKNEYLEELFETFLKKNEHKFVGNFSHSVNFLGK